MGPRISSAPVARLEYLDVEIGLPFGLGKIGGRWSPDRAEREAAWEMYVGLATRMSVQEVRPDEGLLREALSSLYSLFEPPRGTSFALTAMRWQDPGERPPSPLARSPWPS